MGVLQRFERRIERLVNRPFARAFKAEVQPVEVASALQRECDDRAAIVARDRTMVPNDFVVELGDADFERLSPYSEALGETLADMVREHAEEQHYIFVGPVSVTLERVPDLDTGMFRIHSDVVRVPGVGPDAGPDDAPPGAPRAVDVLPGDAGFRRRNARGEEAGAALLINNRTFPLVSGVTVLGRGTDADIRLDDPGVSRRHAEIRRSGEVTVVVDLGSTNGTHVNGQPVHQARLSDGDSFQVGTTTVVFRSGVSDQPGR